eukprot:CAMPEP_0119491282 /NCGR_PEP_ID=MMETSP1344-20130328/16208_1 /TAXON_ID=236787 /ORGANISM="Florenciella parvula, Strain CCMP2471" /LENGTH=76 /DNA_ID=CAMNT_0007526525 /DNA_START=1 /DNA_END=228 /DNA_ORIENTATION=+
MLEEFSTLDQPWLTHIVQANAVRPPLPKLGPVRRADCLDAGVDFHVWPELCEKIVEELRKKDPDAARRLSELEMRE